MPLPPRDPRTGRFMKRPEPALPALAPAPAPSPFAIGNRRVTAAALAAQSARIGKRTRVLPRKPAEVRAEMRERRAAARERGYTGPLTRADLARAARP